MILIFRNLHPHFDNTVDSILIIKFRHSVRVFCVTEITEPSVYERDCKKHLVCVIWLRDQKSAKQHVDLTLSSLF